MDLYVFDFHGTLAKGNEHAVVESTNLSLEKHGRKERLTVEDALRWQGRPWANYFRELCPDVDEKEMADMVSYAKTFDDYVIPKHTLPMKHALEVLEQIKRNRDKILVISSTTPDVLDLYLECVGMSGLIDDRLGITEYEEKCGELNVGELKAKKLREYIKDKNFNRIRLVGDTGDDIKAGKLIGAITFYYNPDSKTHDAADYSILDLRQLLTK